MATCVVDFANEHKDILPKDIIEKIARQDRELSKRFANDPAKLAEAQTEAIAYWASEVAALKHNDISNMVKEKTIMDSVNTFAEHYQKKHKVDRPTAEAMVQAVFSMTEGSTEPNMPGGRLSIDALQKSRVKMYDDFFFTYLENEGLMAYVGEEHLLPILEAKKRMQLAGASVEISKVGIDPYDRIAAAMIRTDFLIQDGYGHAGSAQTQRMSFVNDSGHDPNKIAMAEYTTWRDTLIAALDKEQPMYDTPKGASFDTIDNILRETWNMITRGDFAEFDSHRNFNWAEPKAYIEYNRKFGSGASWNGMYAHSIQRAARRQAIIQKLGTQPERVMNNVISRAREINTQVGDYKPQFEEAWQNALGKVFADYGPAHLTNEMVKHVNTIAGMHSAGFTAVAGDIPAMIFTHHADIGEGMAHAVMDNVSGLVESIGHVTNSKESRAILRDAGVSLEEHLLYAEPPVDIAQVTPGYKQTTAKAYNTTSGVLNVLSRFNQWTNGLKPWTRMGKMAAAKIMNAKLKKYSKMAWEDIPVDFQETILSFMDKEDFQNFQHMDADYTFSGLNQLIERADRLTLPDKYLAPLEHMAKEKLGVSDKAKEAYEAKERKNYAHNLKQKVMAMMIQNMDEAIPTPGAKERRQLGAGKKRSQAQEIIRANMAQYKSTAMATFNQVQRQYRKYNSPVQRALYIGGRVGMGTITSMMSHSLLYAATHQGTLPWDDKNFEGWERYLMFNMVRGGGAGLVGDYLLGAATDKERMLGGIVGPTTKIYADIVEGIYQSATGDQKTSEIQKQKLYKLLLKNVPFGGNVFLYNFRKGYIDTIDATIKELRKQQQGARRRRHKFQR